MDALLRDLRAATRALTRSPAFTLVSVLCFALGIGATSTIFGVLDSLFLRPPAGVGHPERLVRMYVTPPPAGGAPEPLGQLASPFGNDYRTLRDNTRSLRGLAAYGGLEDVSVGAGAGAASAPALLVTGNYFSVLAVTPSLGRFFLPGEDAGPGSPPAVVVSHTFWQRHLRGDPSTIGSTLDVNGYPFTIIGVAPAGFHGIDPGVTDVWIPGSQMAHVRLHFELLAGEASGWEQIVGRLAVSASPDAVRQELNTILQHGSGPTRRLGQTPRMTLGPILAARGPHPAPQAVIARWLALASALVLGIACVNVANLLLARAATRRTEMAIRLSIGASRWRIARMLLVESLVLAGLGASAGILLAIWGARLVPSVGLPPLAFFAQGRVLVFAATATVVCGVSFGLAPALSATGAELAVALKDSGESDPRSRLRALLVTAQMALASVLLTGAGLFVHSLSNLQAIEPGFDVAHLVRVSGDLASAGYSDTAITAFYEQAAQRLRDIPGVEATTLASPVPLNGTQVVQGYHVPNRLDPAASGASGSGYRAFVGSDYFTTIGTPLIHGRDFTERDRKESLPVAVVNETLARREWPRGSPIGECIRVTRDVCYTIVGVAANAQYVRLDEDPRAAVFIPVTQMESAVPARLRALLVQAENAHLTLLVRATHDPVRVIPAVRHALRQLAPSLPYMRVEALTDMLHLEIQPRRLGATMFSLFGGLALVLATIGLYGVMSYTVQRRTREMGVRIALGAAPMQVLGLVVRQGALLVALGLAIGLSGGLALGHLVAHLLFGVTAMDPVAFAGACLLLGGAGLLAAYLPARRAMRVDPVDALRVE